MVGLQGWVDRFQESRVEPQGTGRELVDIVTYLEGELFERWVDREVTTKFGGGRLRTLKQHPALRKLWALLFHPEVRLFVAERAMDLMRRDEHAPAILVYVVLLNEAISITEENFLLDVYREAQIYATLWLKNRNVL